MSLDHIYTPEEENQVFGRDATITYLSGGGLDLQIDDTGDIQLSNGLTELVLSHITMLLSTNHDYISRLGELPFHPTFGSALPTLLLASTSTEEQLEVIQNEIYLSIFSHFPDLISGVEFGYVKFDKINRRMEMHMTVYTVTSSVGSLVMVI